MSEKYRSYQKRSYSVSIVRHRNERRTVRRRDTAKGKFTLFDRSFILYFKMATSNNGSFRYVETAFLRTDNALITLLILL